jgi:hypothetical protein
MSAQFIQRGIQFLIGNALIWSAIVFEVFRLNVSVGIMTTAGSAFCLFGGLILRRWLSMFGDWIAVGLTALMAFLFLQMAGPQ